MTYIGSVDVKRTNGENFGEKRNETKQKAGRIQVSVGVKFGSLGEIE